MRAVKLDTVISENRKLSLTVPPEIPSGPVEVLILSKEGAEGQKASLLAFLDALASAPASTRSPEEIEESIQAERSAWDE